jgi:hypothetical protein
MYHVTNYGEAMSVKFYMVSATLFIVNFEKLYSKHFVSVSNEL